jgi:hypothetical protein
MRVYTKVVWEWRGSELVEVESHHYEYDGPVDLMKGGSSGPDNYANLERLYGIQADQAQFLGETFKGTVAPAYKKWLGEAEDFGSTANQEATAERAGKAVSGATTQQQHAMEGQLASMGINPADARYSQGMREMGIQGAAQQAAAETTARDSVRDKGFARMQDAIGMGMGTPTQASQAANSAANAATSGLNAQQQSQQNQANSVGNIVRAGTNVWGAYNDTSKADGGQVHKNGILRLKGGGYVSRQHLAMGGMAGAGKGGFMATPQIQAPPPSRPPPPPSGVEQGAAVAGNPMTMKMAQQGIGKAAEMGGQAANSPTVQAFGRGLQMSPADAAARGELYKKAAEVQVDKAMGAEQLSGPNAELIDTTTAVPTPGAEELAGGAQQLAGPGVEEAAAAAAQDAALQATAEGATEAAATEAAAAAATEAAAAEATAAAAAAEGTTALAASGAGMAGAAAVGTAVPVLGAGLALYGIGNAAGWWADGGQVQPGGGGPPPDPGSGSDRWKWADPAWGINQIAHKNNWWADGGEVTPGSQQQTGEVDGPGGPKDDEVMAALSDGEFVMPVGAVRLFGLDRMEKMRQKGLEHEKTLGISR